MTSSTALATLAPRSFIAFKRSNIPLADRAIWPYFVVSAIPRFGATHMQTSHLARWIVVHGLTGDAVKFDMEGYPMALTAYYPEATRYTSQEAAAHVANWVQNDFSPRNTLAGVPLFVSSI